MVATSDEIRRKYQRPLELEAAKLFPMPHPEVYQYGGPESIDLYVEKCHQVQKTRDEWITRKIQEALYDETGMEL